MLSFDVVIPRFRASLRIDRSSDLRDLAPGNSF
jgi:hypothetical protein